MSTRFDLARLKLAEQRFLSRYPGGFTHPEMQQIKKKHQFEQLCQQVSDDFSSSAFNHTEQIVQAMVKAINRSSMISLFEKPKFKTFIQQASAMDIAQLSDGLKAFIHGTQQQGFEQMLEVLKPAKLAKWSLMTIIPNYYAPNEEVFVKPTTAKGVVKYFNLQELVYKPAPSWGFYAAYREIILQMKEHVDESLKSSNAAFCGFLMMTLDSLE